MKDKTVTRLVFFSSWLVPHAVHIVGRVNGWWGLNGEFVALTSQFVFGGGVIVGLWMAWRSER